MKRLLLVCCLLFAPVLVRAGGFQLNEHGVRAIGMAFAVVTEPADASTVFFNPAGMALLPDGLHVTAGLALIAPGARFTGPTNPGATNDLNRFTTTNMELWMFPIPHAYAAYKVPNSDLAVGLGIFVPFGAGTLWNENWTGRNLAIRTYIQTITINPNVAYSFFDKKVSIAAGLTYSLGHAEIRNRVINFNPEPFLNLSGNGTAISFNGGIIIEPVKNLRIAAAYRHNIQMSYKGNATFTLDAAGTQALPAGMNNVFADGPGGTSLNLPFDLRTGISYKFGEGVGAWSAEFAFDYVGWSSYDTLRINFDRLPGAPYRRNATTGAQEDNPGTVLNPRNYYNAPAFRLGVENTASETLKLRAGVF